MEQMDRDQLDDDSDDLVNDEDLTGDEDDISGGFGRFERVCPACRQPVTEQMDSCPYCGDIVFRYLTDGTFAPRKGPMVKVVAALIVLLVVAAVLGMLMLLIF